MNWIKNKPLYLISGCLITAILIVLDQITKFIAIDKLKGQETVWLIKDVLCFQYLENTGAAFSIMEGKMNFFLVVTPIVCILIGLLYYRLFSLKKFGPMQVICLFVLAGAIGNYIDRVKNAYVVDFIYFSLIDFPIFNVADIYVSCSVVLLIILVMFYYKESDLNSFKLFSKKDKED